MSTAAQEILFFADFEYRRPVGELFRDGKPLALQQIQAAILGMLLERPGELVTREEIIKRVWPNSTVDFDQRISSSIKEIRKALNDDSKEPRFIKTIPRQGYRFVAPVSAQQSPTIAPAPGVEAVSNSSTSLRKFMPAILSLIAAAFVIAFLVAQLSWPPDVAGEQQQKAQFVMIILPTVAEDKYDKELAARLTDQIMLRFSADKPVFVELVTNDTAAALAGDPDLLPRALDELGAKYVMNTEIRRVSTQRSVIVSLISADSQILSWSQSFDLPFIERRRLSEQSATEIVQALNQQLAK